MNLLKRLYFLLPPLAQAAAVWVWWLPAGTNGWWTAGTGFLITLWASLSLFSDPRPYSFNRMFWLFVMVFLGLLPAVQIGSGNLPWGNNVAPETFLRANILILAGCTVYSLVRAIAKATESEKPLHLRARATPALVRAHKWVALPAVLVLAIAYFLIVGKGAFLQKYTILQWRDVVPDAVYLSVEKILRIPVLVFTLLTIFLFRLRLLSKRFLIGTLLLCAAVNFPLAMPRTFSAAMLLGIALSFGGRLWQRQRQALTLLILAGLFGVVPLLQAARWTSDHQKIPLSNPGVLYARTFTGGDFDAYSMLCRTLEYTHSNGHTSGAQLLTTLAFAVPRKLWSGKGEGTGARVHRAQGGYINVSAPLLAEGYIDFGTAGALLYLALCALLAVRYDSYYWRWRMHRAAAGDFSFRTLFYPVMLVLFVLLLRGDALSALALLVSCWILGWVFLGFERLVAWFFRKRSAASISLPANTRSEITTPDL